MLTFILVFITIITTCIQIYIFSTEGLAKMQYRAIVKPLNRDIKKDIIFIISFLIFLINITILPKI